MTVIETINTTSATTFRSRVPGHVHEWMPVYCYWDEYFRNGDHKGHISEWWCDKDDEVEDDEEHEWCFVVVPFPCEGA